MIDFANTILGTTTHDGTSDDHNSPDQGFLYGLEQFNTIVSRDIK